MTDDSTDLVSGLPHCLAYWPTKLPCLLLLPRLGGTPLLRRRVAGDSVLRHTALYSCSRYCHQLPDMRDRTERRGKQGHYRGQHAAEVSSCHLGKVTTITVTFTTLSPDRGQGDYF